MGVSAEPKRKAFLLHDVEEQRRHPRLERTQVDPLFWLQSDAVLPQRLFVLFDQDRNLGATNVELSTRERNTNKGSEQYFLCVEKITPKRCADHDHKVAHKVCEAEKQGEEERVEVG